MCVCVGGGGGGVGGGRDEGTWGEGRGGKGREGAASYSLTIPHWERTSTAVSKTVLVVTNSQ